MSYSLFSAPKKKNQATLSLKTLQNICDTVIADKHNAVGNFSTIQEQAAIEPFPLVMDLSKREL